MRNMRVLYGCDQLLDNPRAINLSNLLMTAGTVINRETVGALIDFILASPHGWQAALENPVCRELVSEPTGAYRARLKQLGPTRKLQAVRKVVPPKRAQPVAKLAKAKAAAKSRRPVVPSVPPPPDDRPRPDEYQPSRYNGPPTLIEDDDMVFEELQAQRNLRAEYAARMMLDDPRGDVDGLIIDAYAACVKQWCPDNPNQIRILSTRDHRSVRNPTVRGMRCIWWASRGGFSRTSSRATRRSWNARTTWCGWIPSSFCRVSRATGRGRTDRGCCGWWSANRRTR